MDKLSVVIAVARSIPYNHDDRTVVVILTYISMHAEISIRRALSEPRPVCVGKRSFLHWLVFTALAYLLYMTQELRPKPWDIVIDFSGIRN